MKVIDGQVPLKKGECCCLEKASEDTLKYCRKSTGWKMTKDDDRNMIRKYNPFCPEHQEQHDQQVQVRKERVAQGLCEDCGKKPPCECEE